MREIGIGDKSVKYMERERECVGSDLSVPIIESATSMFVMQFFYFLLRSEFFCLDLLPPLLMGRLNLRLERL